MSLGGQNTDGTNAGEIFVSFNQDCSSLVAGSSNGYHLYTITADNGIEEIYASNSGQETSIVERLFCSSLVAIVTVSAPRKLIVCHYKKGTEICNYSYSNSILAVKINRSRLVVCLEESLHIHNIRDMKVLHTIRETPANARGLCALAPSAERCLLAYPGSRAQGEVQVFDACHLTAACAIAAHDAPLAALAFSACGRRLATASERGTVLRVFAVPEARKLHELRRGVSRCVAISCLAFSNCGLLLAASSNTETVHVFRLEEEEAAKEGAQEAEDASWASWLAGAVAKGAELLPARVGAALAPGRALFAARLPAPARRHALALTTGPGGVRLVVATSLGAVLAFALDAGSGSCRLLRASRLPAPGCDARDEPRPRRASGGNSYAGALRGRDPLHMSESARESELSAAASEAPRGLDLADDELFPPIRARPAPADE